MKNKKILAITISIITAISFVIGFSYAYFTAIVIGNDTASSNSMTSEVLQLTYNGSDFIDLENGVPNATDSLTFTVTNSGNDTLDSYNIYFSKIINTFLYDEAVYEIECVSSDAVPCDGKVETPIPTTEELAITQGAIAPGTTHTYTFIVLFIDTGSPQDYNQGKELTFTITVEEIIYLPGNIVAMTGWADTRYFWDWDYRYNITKIVFEDTVDIPLAVVQSWDITEEQNGKIIAYVIDDGLASSTYELHILSNQAIKANANSSNYFAEFVSLTSFENLNLLNTSNVTNMTNMFNYCTSLTTINIGLLDSSNVTLMNGILANDFLLTSVNFTNFDTSSATSMVGMFSGSNNLISLDLSSFNTSLVTSFEEMFYDCNDLTSVDLSSFNTLNVTNMGFMFYNCNSLTSLDLSSFYTTNLTIMYQMFSFTSSLETLLFNNGIFTSIVSYASMFWGTKTGLSITVTDSTAYAWILYRYNNPEPI